MSEPLEKSVRVRCSVQHAFTVFTERVDTWWPRGHRRFEDSSLRLEPHVGGRFIEERGEDSKELGEVRAWDPPTRVCFSWWPGALEGPTEVEVRFIEDGDATLVEVTHRVGDSGLGGAWPGRVAIFGRNWDDVLEALREHVSRDPE